MGSLTNWVGPWGNLTFELEGVTLLHPVVLTSVAVLHDPPRACTASQRLRVERGGTPRCSRPARREAARLAYTVPATSREADTCVRPARALADDFPDRYPPFTKTASRSSAKPRNREVTGMSSAGREGARASRQARGCLRILDLRQHPPWRCRCVQPTARRSTRSPGRRLRTWLAMTWPSWPIGPYRGLDPRLHGPPRSISAWGPGSPPWSRPPAWVVPISWRPVA